MRIEGPWVTPFGPKRTHKSTDYPIRCPGRRLALLLYSQQNRNVCAAVMLRSTSQDRTGPMNPSTKRVHFWYIFFLLHALPVHAHSPGQSYLFLQVYEDRVEGRIEIALADAALAVRLDTDGDGDVSEPEFAGGVDELRRYIVERVELTLDGTVHAIELGLPRVQTSLVGRYAVGEFEIDGLASAAKRIGVSYNLLFEESADHKGLLVVEFNAHTGAVNDTEAVSLVFTPARRARVLDLTADDWVGELVRFVEEGVWHIWIGLDHVLFLIALLLPAVLVRSASRWDPSPGFRRAFLNVLRIVTLFTLAHSLTLCLAALDKVQLSPRLVESVIAISIAFAALNNLFQWFPERSGWIICGFGFFHGFGFASVLGHLGLQPGSLLVPLFGFNLGVEFGQVAILLVAFPLLYGLRRSRLYVPLVLGGGSVVLTAVAAYWCIQRIFLEP